MYNICDGPSDGPSIYHREIEGLESSLNLAFKLSGNVHLPFHWMFYAFQMPSPGSHVVLNKTCRAT
jgi:hypothetical protein